MATNKTASRNTAKKLDHTLGNDWITWEGNTKEIYKQEYIIFDLAQDFLKIRIILEITAVSRIYFNFLHKNLHRNACKKSNNWNIQKNLAVLRRTILFAANFYNFS